MHLKTVVKIHGITNYDGDEEDYERYPLLKPTDNVEDNIKNVFSDNNIKFIHIM